MKHGRLFNIAANATFDYEGNHFAKMVSLFKNQISIGANEVSTAIKYTDTSRL